VVAGARGAGDVGCSGADNGEPNVDGLDDEDDDDDVDNDDEDGGGFRGVTAAAAACVDAPFIESYAAYSQPFTEIHMQIKHYSNHCTCNRFLSLGCGSCCSMGFFKSMLWP
jgi:hypothetical protein